MRRKRIWLPLLALSLLLLVSHSQTVQATVEGKTYYFTTSSSETYEENGVSLYKIQQDAWFKIVALNVTRELVYYDFEGFHYTEGAEVEYRLGVDVNFQDNLVHFDLYTDDPDNDSLSGFPYLTVNPSDSHHEPGGYVFVNPTFDSHDTDWQQAIDDVEEQSSVSQSTFNAPGDGTFSFSIAVDIEAIDYIDDTAENATGVRRFDFSAVYDADGVLNTLLLTATTMLNNENFTSRFISARSVTRTSGPSLGGGVALDTTLVAVGIAIPVSLLIGALIGRKVWGGL
ncbi:MAG: hypothetical protein RTU30_02505 [Candidatus Thorarchaeota archaeon]